MIKVRRMTASDVNSICEIERECFTRPWNERNFLDSLNNGCSVFFVSVDGGIITGFIGADKVGGEVYISNVAVREKFRKRGVASALIDAMNSYCIDNNAEFITLEVRVSNTPAVNLYEKSGFENLGRRKNFYSAPNEDAFIMTKYFLKE